MENTRQDNAGRNFVDPKMRESKLTRTERDFFHDIRMGAPRKGQGGLPDPLDFDINFSHIITVAPRVEIQMHFLERG